MINTYPKLSYCRAICRFDIIGSVDMSAQDTFIIIIKIIKYCHLTYLVMMMALLLNAFGNKQKICGYLKYDNNLYWTINNK